MLIEARLYAQDSIQHTMDYIGWEDQHNKQERITYGKFGQLWVSEFCRLNKIPHEKDRSSPTQADDLDLTIMGKMVDVKTTVIREFVGQISPGVFNKPCDEYCFIVTDRQCSFVTPIGFVSQEDYKKHCVHIKKGEIIPGTSREQKFGGGSYFLPHNSKVCRPFVYTLMKWINKSGKDEKFCLPIMLIDSSEMFTVISKLDYLTNLVCDNLQSRV